MATQEETVQEITRKFAGKWKEVRSENVDAFFREMGLNFLLRKIASQAKPEMEFVMNGTDIQIGFKTPFRTENLKFKLNEEVEVDTQRGKFLATTTYENGKVITRQKPVPGNDAKPSETEREINEAGEMVTTIRVGDVVCKRIFTKLQ